MLRDRKTSKKVWPIGRQVAQHSTAGFAVDVGTATAIDGGRATADMGRGTALEGFPGA